MLTRVTERALEFNRSFVLEMMNGYRTNGRRLMIAMQVLHDSIEQDVTQRQREMLQMYYFDKLSTPEIAQQLRVNKSTVSRTMRRAKERIRKNLRFYFDYMNADLAEE